MVNYKGLLPSSAKITMAVPQGSRVDSMLFTMLVRCLTEPLTEQFHTFKEGNVDFQSML